MLPLSALRRILVELEGVSGCGPLSGRRYEEFSFEVNPEDIVERGREYVRDLLALGVTRISMGVQSLDDGILRWMNRRHTAEGAREACRILSSFRDRLRISLDLITGVPGMTRGMLDATLDEVIGWRPGHISAYQLGIDDGSALADMVERGDVQELGDEECRAQYDLVCSRLREAGYHHYEISNWALPGQEAVHNSAYWTRHPYAGLGPGAHSLSIGAGGEERRSWNSTDIAGWTSSCEVLTPDEIREECIMLGLRTDRGADIPGNPVRHVTIPEGDWFIADDIISDLL